MVEVGIMNVLLVFGLSILIMFVVGLIVLFVVVFFKLKNIVGVGFVLLLFMLNIIILE